MDSRKVPAAQLLPTVTRAMIAKHARGDVYAVRWCDILGVPFVMDAGRPVDIEVGTREVVMVVETQAEPRHIYIDRTEHVDKDDWDPDTTGDSIAHWEADTLVIDTVGFSATHGITSIPGGGFKTETSHLIERIHLTEGGRVLSISSTWTDPAVYKAPHTYEYRYYRLPGTYEAPPQAECNAWDEERAKFLESTSAAKAK